MRTVLGIDAAWTDRNPSGVALIAEQDGQWRCKAVAPSYKAFLAISRNEAADWAARHLGEQPDLDGLIIACRALTGSAPDVIAIDMPLSRLPITGYRAADRALSKVFSAFKCSVLPPSETMPGPISDRLRATCGTAGWPLATDQAAPITPALIEVYPHAAIVRLMNLRERLTYKESRARKYWPLATASERRTALAECLTQLRAALDDQITDIVLPTIHGADPIKRHAIKAYEDAMDALVCAWVGAEYLAGRAEAFGDSTAAIWVPKARL